MDTTFPFPHTAHTHMLTREHTMQYFHAAGIIHRVSEKGTLIEAVACYLISLVMPNPPDCVGHEDKECSTECRCHATSEYGVCLHLSICGCTH